MPDGSLLPTASLITMKELEQTPLIKLLEVQGFLSSAERNLWQNLIVLHKALVEESEEDSGVVGTFSWVVLKTGMFTYLSRTLLLTSSCIINHYCQQDGSVNRMLAGGKPHTPFSFRKGSSYREQQTARRNPWRAQQNRCDKGKIWGGKPETTASSFLFNLPFMAYAGKAKSLSRTHSQPLSLFHCQICCLVWGLETNDFFFFFSF